MLMFPFVLLEHPAISKFQVSVDLEIALLFSIQFVQHTSTTDSKEAPEHDATTMVDIWYSVFRFQSLSFIPPSVPLVIVAKKNPSLCLLWP